MVKTKFAGLLRGILRRMDRNDAPARTDSQSVSSAGPTASGSATSPASSSASPAPEAAFVTTPPGENEIALPLAPVIAALPLDLRAKIMVIPPPGLTINLPVETVVTQLAFGAVRITFGELRQMAPGVFANSGGELDGKQVVLPLNEILSRINPSLLSRRTGSKVEVAEEISGPFNGRGQGLAFTSEPLKAPKAAPAPAPEPAPVPESKTSHFSRPAMGNAPIAFRPPPGAELLPKPSTNGHRVPPLAPPPPAAPMSLKISAAPAPVPPAPVPAPVTPRPEPAQPMIYAGLWDLAENWPEELKNEISRSNLANLNVPLAGNVVEAGLKRGRLTMTWKQVRLLAKPSSTPSSDDDLELELPLKVIAPLFFAAKKNLPQARKAATVSSDIPNLFFGFPQAAPEPPVSAPKPVLPKPAPLEQPVAAAPKPVVEKPVFEKAALEKPFDKKNTESNSNFYVWGDDGEVPKLEENIYAPPPVPQTDFTSRRALPKDVVAQAVKLPGVAGAVITLPDGLRVASEMTAGLNPDTISAFIPQIYERMNQSTRELRMGILNNVAFTVGNVPWKIFRVNSVYFAVFGLAGASLPSAQLTQLAGELDRKK